MTGGERLGRTKSCKYECYNRERLRGGYIESISLDIREADRRRGEVTVLFLSFCTEIVID
jgi:hypothetical protein